MKRGRIIRRPMDYIFKIGDCIVIGDEGKIRRCVSHTNNADLQKAIEDAFGFPIERLTQEQLGHYVKRVQDGKEKLYFY